MNKKIKSPCEKCELKREGCKFECIRIRAFANEQPKMQFIKSIERGKHKNPVKIRINLEEKLAKS